VNEKQLRTWFGVVSVIAVAWGVVFAVFGLGILPLDRSALSWESALYGSIMIGWGTTLFLLGRVVFRRNDPELIRPLLIGVTLWLVVEAVFSARFGVWFNVGVDAVVLALFSVPLLGGLRQAKREDHVEQR
jgi:hypothetical protein